MNLHDLAEDLPVNWDKIPEVAKRAHEIYLELELKRATFKSAGA
ncbi:MAG: CCE_0567 family metalloprotein [Acidobacteriaceae bacterium]